MPFSTYEVTVPVYRGLIATFSKTLDKAVAYADEKAFDVAILVAARLYPDMYSLVEQVFAFTNHMVRGTARLAGVPVPKYEGRSEGIDDIRARLAWTLAHFDGLTAQQFAGAHEKTIVFPAGDEEKRMSGSDYLLTFSLPHTYFHVTMAYAILRHNGLPLNKDDFMPA
ncbi:MAG: DUF1993 domain-containing protein [Bauldia sp.]